jgi:hypothetical protein
MRASSIASAWRRAESTPPGAGGDHPGRLLDEISSTGEPLEDLRLAEDDGQGSAEVVGYGLRVGLTLALGLLPPERVDEDPPDDPEERDGRLVPDPLPPDRVEAEEPDHRLAVGHRHQKRRPDPLSLEDFLLRARLRRQALDARDGDALEPGQPARGPGELLGRQVLEAIDLRRDALGAPLVAVAHRLPVGGEEEHVAAVGADDLADAPQRSVDALVEAAGAEADEVG